MDKAVKFIDFFMESATITASESGKLILMGIRMPKTSDFFILDFSFYWFIAIPSCILKNAKFSFLMGEPAQRLFLHIFPMFQYPLLIFRGKNVMKKGSEKFYGNNILHIKGGEFVQFYCNFLFSALQMPGGRGIL